MRHRLLTVKTVVAPLGAPRYVYGLSVVSFEASEDLNALYGRLRAGYAVGLQEFDLLPFESECPSLLMAEFPLLLSQRGDTDWALTRLTTDAT